MKPLKLIDYSLVVVSMIYSTYVTFWYANEYFETIPIALILSAFIVFLAHHYTYQSILYFKLYRKLNQYIVLSFVLTAMIFFAEWNGQLLHAEKNIVGIKTTASIDHQIAQTQEIIFENAKHTNKGKTNWAKYQTFLDANKSIKVLEERRKDLLIEIASQKVEAETTANTFRLLSLVLFLLAFLASSVSSKELNTVILNETIDHKKNKIIDLIKCGEINSSQMLIDYFNLSKEESMFLLKKHSPTAAIGF